MLLSAADSLVPHHDAMIASTVNRTKPFHAVEPGSDFLVHESLYQKYDDYTAKLVRWASGHEPEEPVFHNFDHDDLVTLLLDIAC